MTHEDVGVHDCYKLMEQVWLELKQFRCELFHHPLQLLCCYCWDTIPRFGLAPKSKSSCCYFYFE